MEVDALGAKSSGQCPLPVGGRARSSATSDVTEPPPAKRRRALPSRCKAEPSAESVPKRDSLWKDGRHGRGGLFVGQRVRLARDIGEARKGDVATVLGPRESETAPNALDKNACVRLETGQRLDVHLRNDLHLDLPRGFKWWETVAVATDLRVDGEVVAQVGDHVIILGPAREKPEENVFVELCFGQWEPGASRLYNPNRGKRVEVPAEHVKSVDVARQRHPDLGSVFRVIEENPERDFQESRVGTAGMHGVLVDRKVPLTRNAYGTDGVWAEEITLRFESGKICTYKASAVSWVKIYNRMHSGWERKKDPLATVSNTLQHSLEKLTRAHSNFQQYCEVDFRAGGVPRPVQTGMTLLGDATEELRKAIKAGRSSFQALTLLRRNAAQRKNNAGALSGNAGSVSSGRQKRQVSMSVREASRKKSDKLTPWIAAKKAAREALQIKGFCAFKKGTPEYKKARELYDKRSY